VNSPAEPRLSIVIPVYNNWWLTERCLRALDGLRERCRVAFETIVVDNASTDETPSEILQFQWVRYLRNENNRNFAGACNDGAAIAVAPLVLFLNNDAYPLGDALTPLIHAFERLEVTIASGALVYEDGVTQDAGLVVLPNAHWHHFFRNLPSSLPEVRDSRDALAVGGAAMTVRTQWFRDAGGFDETFINGFEDVDLCLRARDECRGISYVADAIFAHYEGASEGRFAREHENERRFYQRWSSTMAELPRVQRGAVGAIVVCAGEEDALLTASREDLERALASFGHPVVHERFAPLQWLDRRYRSAASLGWFRKPDQAPSVTLSRDASFSVLRVCGVVKLAVPWLPCAAGPRVERCALRASAQSQCVTIAICGDGDLAIADGNLVRVTAEMLLGGGEPIEAACVVHYGLTDDAAFGNVLLAQAGVPAVVLDTPELRAIFADDVALFTDRRGIEATVRRFVNDAALRERYGRRLAADATRRFSPRRTAIRVVDLLCAARFGLERPGKAVSNSPLTFGRSLRRRAFES
jgi:GT2 family glycosyltransferase